MAEAEDDAVFGVGATPIIAQRGEFDAAGGGARDHGRIAQQYRVEATVDGKEPVSYTHLTLPTILLV